VAVGIPQIVEDFDKTDLGLVKLIDD